MTATQTPRNIVLSVAGLRLALDIAALSPGQQRGLVGDYAPFLLPHPAGCDCLDMDLVVDLVVAEGPGFLAPEPGHLWRIDLRRQSGRLVYCSYQEQGWIDLNAGRGHLLLRPGAQPENFLRVAFTQLALAHGGLLLHASGLIHDRHGYVFFGHSGAGKSTVAGFAPAGSTLLSDDLVLLRLHREPLCSAPGRLWLHGVPFRGEALPVPRPNAAAPVAGLYALRQASGHALEQLPSPLSAARLLACTPFIDGDPRACRQALAVCKAIAQAVPIHTLAFARDPGFWHLLTGKEARIYDHHG